MRVRVWNVVGRLRPCPPRRDTNRIDHHHHHHHRRWSSLRRDVLVLPIVVAHPNMSSDAAYASFLDQANQDTGAKVKTSGAAAASSSSPSSGFATTRSVDTDVPTTLGQVDRYTYSSDTDEPFEAVSLQWSRSTLPDRGTFDHFSNRLALNHRQHQH